MTTSKLKVRTKLRERPLFIGGALHGVAVPELLADRQIIRAYTIAAEEFYVKTTWWSIDGSFPFFVKIGTEVNDSTALVRHMLSEGL